MDHKLLDQVKQDFIVFRKLRGHETVNLLWSAQLCLRFKKNDDMSMRKATLLKLNGVEISDNLAQNTILDVMNERLKLGMKSANHQVRAITGSLAREEVVFDLRPGRIGSHGDEKVPSTKVAINGQCILTMLLHVASAARKARRQNKPLAQIVQVGISISCHCISQALIDINMQLALIVSDKTEVILLCNSPCFTDKFLEEPASKKEMVGLNFFRVNVKAIVKVFTHRDMLFLIILIALLLLIIEDRVVPTKLSSGKEKDIVQGGIKRMEV